jgi:hypothetical protein
MNRFLLKYAPLWAPEDGGAAAAAATAAAAAAAAAAPPWHAGIEADTLGFWQNKGYPVDDPKALAGKLTEQYRSLEKHIGAPADRILRLPEKTDDVAGWNGIYSRLGVPAEAKDYDLSTVKHADGTDVDAAFADSLRAGLLKGRVPKDLAPELAKAVIKSLDDKQAADLLVYKTKADAEMAELKKNWGPNYDFNHLKAMEGARKLGLTKEAAEALIGPMGNAGVMEAMRKIGANTSEDAFHGAAGAAAIRRRSPARSRSSTN